MANQLTIRIAAILAFTCGLLALPTHGQEKKAKGFSWFIDWSPQMTRLDNIDVYPFGFDNFSLAGAKNQAIGMTSTIGYTLNERVLFGLSWDTSGWEAIHPSNKLNTKVGINTIGLLFGLDHMVTDKLFVRTSARVGYAHLGTRVRPWDANESYRAVSHGFNIHGSVGIGFKVDKWNSLGLSVGYDYINTGKWKGEAIHKEIMKPAYIKQALFKERNVMNLPKISVFFTNTF